MESIIEKLPPRQRQLYDAFLKIQTGERLLTEGKLALDLLVKSGVTENGRPIGGKDVSKAIEKLAASKKKKPKKHKKTIANRTLKVKAKSKAKLAMVSPDPKIDQELADKILAFVKGNEKVTTQLLMKKLKRSFYPIKRALVVLLKKDQIKSVESKENPAHSHWVVG